MIEDGAISTPCLNVYKRQIQWAALGTGFTFLMTTLGAAVVFFLTGEPKPRFQKTALGFAAGVMTAASVWSLLLPCLLYTSRCV